MKKCILDFLLISYILTSAACTGAPSGNTEEFSDLELAEWGESNRMVFGDLEQLEKHSDIIVVGTFNKDSEQEEIYQYDGHFEKDVLATVISTNSIEVSKVIKGDVNVGDTVPITQDYGVIDNQLVTTSELTPMLKGDTWIFFLSENTSEIRAGKYSCTGDNDGRYPLKNFSYRRIALTDNEDLGVYNKEDFREDIYSEILEKYDFE